MRTEYATQPIVAHKQRAYRNRQAPSESYAERVGVHIEHVVIARAHHSLCVLKTYAECDESNGVKPAGAPFVQVREAEHDSAVSEKVLDLVAHDWTERRGRPEREVNDDSDCRPAKDETSGTRKIHRADGKADGNSTA